MRSAPSGPQRLVSIHLLPWQHMIGWLHTETGKLKSNRTSFLAVLDPVALEVDRAHPLRRTPLQCDGAVADVVHAQADGLARGGWKGDRAGGWVGGLQELHVCSSDVPTTSQRRSGRYKA